MVSVALPIIEAYDRARTKHLDQKPFRAICYSPFNSMFLDTKGHIRACCVNTRYILGDIRKNRLDEIWWGDRAHRLRAAMMDYNLKLGCEFCEWQLGDGNFAAEESHYSSLHALKYDAFPLIPNGDGEWWPTNLEFNLSNVCNLECVMCDGFFSSAIRSRREKLPPLPKPYDDQFFLDLRKYIPHVRTAQFLGGEPFLIKEHFRVWDMMIEDKVIEVCYITTNGTIYNDRVEHILQSLPCAITMSMDGVTKETFEKIRVNAKYDVFMENFRRFSDYLQAKGWCVGLNFTLSRLNWHEYPEMCLFAEAEKSLVAVCTMAEPKDLSIYTLSAAELEPIVAAYEQRDAEMSRVLQKNLASWRNTLDHLRNRLENARKESAMPARLGGTGVAEPVELVEIEPMMQVSPNGTLATEPVSENEGRPASSEGNGHSQNGHHEPAPKPKKSQKENTRVREFWKTPSLSAELQAAEERAALETLCRWSAEGVSSALIDENDLIVTLNGPENRFLGVAGDDYRGSVDDLLEPLATTFGPISEAVELERSLTRIDRLVLFGEEPLSRVYVRVIHLPRFDVAGRLTQVLMLAGVKGTR